VFTRGTVVVAGRSFFRHPTWRLRIAEDLVYVFLSLTVLLLLSFIPETPKY